MNIEPEQFLIEVGGTKETGTGLRFFTSEIAWPPPEVFEFAGDTYQLLSFSKLEKPMAGIIRGAKYLLASEATE